MTLPTLIHAIGAGAKRARNLTREEALVVARAVVSGSAEPVQVGAILLSFRIKGETAEEIAAEIGATGVVPDTKIARVSLVGAGMKSNPGVAATMFEVLAGEGINIEMISTSAIRTSCVVREGEIEQAVQSLHTAFGLDVEP